jgi:DTW domain-containing protein
MSRRANAARRCTRCHMHASLCVCALLPKLVTRTRVVLFIHRAEARKPTNTGRLATECLTHSEVHVRGHESSPTARFIAPPGTQPILLFPHENAIPLDRVALTGEPVVLIVPDGNWRQASKVRARVPGLLEVPCASLPLSTPSRYRLRAEAHAAGLATMEAIARALGILEGPEVERALEDVFAAMVGRTLWARGAVETGAVEGGIPAGAMRHDPTSGSSPA